MHLAGKRGQGKWAVAAAVVAGAVLVACGGGGGGGGTVVVVNPPPPPVAVNGPAWLGFGGDAQHAAVSQIATQDLGRILWRTSVDEAPQYSAQGYLLVHYGSPAITTRNTVLVPVRRATGSYSIEAHAGSGGGVLWTMNSDYVMPPHRWTPSYNVTLTGSNRVYAAASGGRVIYRDNADAANGTPQGIAFYGDTAYSANKAAYDSTVFINTPISADNQGNIYFGFTALAGAPGGMQGGVARIAPNGAGTWVAAAALTQNAQVTKAATNSAPALSTDQKTVYIAVNNSDGTKGYLLALDAATLALKAKVLLLDPQTNLAASVSDDGTASPTVGPDGDVFFGVLETNYAQHNARGWLLHFDASLAQSRTPGSFGWDDTASIVPALMVPGYSGSSKYLIMTKYNNYGRAGSGDSRNKVAVLDPNASQADFITPKVTVMKEVLTVLGVTPDASYPGGVVEWCINTAAVDPFTKSILVNSEDGYLYRWDLGTNSLSQKVKLTSGLGESYTPTAIGPDGTVYAINNAVLFAVGK
jgi:hypothetical protein